METERSTYQMGVDFYSARILEAQNKLADASNDYERVVLVEQIEQWQLRIAQNLRRDEVLNEGKPLTIPEHVHNFVDNL